MSSFNAIARWSRFVPPITLMIAITLASSRSGSELPSLAFRFSDKLVHALAFFVLALLWMRALGTARSAVIATIAVCLVFGGLDELHQSTVPGRFPDFFDFLADTVGTILGVASYRAWRKRRQV